MRTEYQNPFDGTACTVRMGGAQGYMQYCWAAAGSAIAERAFDEPSSLRD